MKYIRNCLWGVWNKVARKCKNILCGKTLKGKYSSLGKCRECGYLVCKECKDWSDGKVMKHIEKYCSAYEPSVK